MDSLSQHQSHIFFGPMFSQNPRRGSTSQMCLHKILSIITTVPPPLAAAAPPFCVKESSVEDNTNGSGFDLNVGGLDVCASPEAKESFLDSSESASSATALEGGGPGSAATGGDQVEDIKIEEAERSLTLLIEAAKLIFGEFLDSDKSESSVSPGTELKQDEVAADEGILGRRSSCFTAEEMVVEFEEPPSSPVVRSKRGRTQMLPGKYRDSVIEPLTRFSRTRSSILPSKRRRR